MLVRLELLGFHLEFGHDQAESEEPTPEAPADAQYPMQLSVERQPYIGFTLDGEGDGDVKHRPGR
jgi:hypothetical protein